MPRNLTRGERIGVSAIAVVAAVALYAGWRVFWFLCDDAFIAFRYVSNSRLGCCTRAGAWSSFPAGSRSRPPRSFEEDWLARVRSR